MFYIFYIVFCVYTVSCKEETDDELMVWKMALET